jgi:exosortase
MALKHPAPAGAQRDTTNGLALGIAILIFAAHVPLIFVHFQQLWLKPHYQLFAAVLAGGFVLLWPIAEFSYGNSPGGLRYGIGCAIIGGILVAIGFLIDFMADLSFLGSPASWVAAGGVALLAAVPVTIFTGLGCVYAINHNPRAGLIAAFAVWLVLAISVFFGSPAGAAVSAIALTGAMTFTIGGWPLLRRCLPALLYLLLIVPPPFMLDTILVQKLQVFASKVSSKILDQMGVYHYLTGVVIDVGKPPPLEIENACTGISSLLTTLACVLFYVIYCRVHWLRATLLTLSGIVWVLVNNSLRIISIGYFRVRWNFDLSAGFPHFLLGLLLFALTLLLLWSTDRLLMFAGRSDETRRRYDPITISAETAHNGLSSLLNLGHAFYRSTPLAVLFGIALAAQIAERVAMARLVPYSGSALSKLYQNMSVEVLPKQVHQWQRWDEKFHFEKRETGNPLGEFSQAWPYTLKPRKPEEAAKCSVSLDFPYPDFHDLRICYANRGWTVLAPETFTYQTEDGLPELYCVKVPMVRPVEQYAYLWFCEFDQDGAGLNPITSAITEETVSERIAARIAIAGSHWQRIFMPKKTVTTTGMGSVLQVQLLFNTKEEKSKADQDALQDLFKKAAEKLRAKCIELKAGKS